MLGAEGSRHPDAQLYATKGTYVSTGLTRGVNLAWLSEQTGVADATLRRHYGRFIHTDADALELSKIDADGPELVQFVPPKGNRSKNPLLYRRNWWSRRDLNPRPLRCERSALPAELLPHTFRIEACTADALIYGVGLTAAS